MKSRRLGKGAKRAFYKKAKLSPGGSGRDSRVKAAVSHAALYCRLVHCQAALELESDAAQETGNRLRNLVRQFKESVIALHLSTYRTRFELRREQQTRYFLGTSRSQTAPRSRSISV